MLSADSQRFMISERQDNRGRCQLFWVKFSHIVVFFGIWVVFAVMGPSSGTGPTGLRAFVPADQGWSALPTENEEPSILKTKTPGTHSLVPGVLFKSLVLNNL